MGRANVSCFGYCIIGMGYNGLPYHILASGDILPPLGVHVKNTRPNRIRIALNGWGKHRERFLRGW